MRLSSIDDVVEHWMIDASSFIARVRNGSRRLGPLLASHRRTGAVMAFIAVGSLFRLPFLFAVVGVSLIIGFLSLWIQHMRAGDQA